MRYIDMQTWSRRNHFRVFRTFNHPHFSMCVNVDVTAFYPFVKRNGYSLTVSMVYLISRASNAIPEFRQRIRGDQVVEHEIVSPSFSITASQRIRLRVSLDWNGCENDWKVLWVRHASQQFANGCQDR